MFKNQPPPTTNSTPVHGMLWIAHNPNSLIAFKVDEQAASNVAGSTPASPNLNQQTHQLQQFLGKLKQFRKPT